VMMDKKRVIARLVRRSDFNQVSSLSVVCVRQTSDNGDASEVSSTRIHI